MFEAPLGGVGVEASTLRKGVGGGPTPLPRSREGPRSKAISAFGLPIRKATAAVASNGLPRWGRSPSMPFMPGFQ